MRFKLLILFLLFPLSLYSQETRITPWGIKDNSLGNMEEIRDNSLGMEQTEIPTSVKNKFLFIGYYSHISNGKMPNILGTDYLTVAGSAGSETYQCPNNATYITADSDKLWFNPTLQTVTTANLIGYDFLRTIVKYDDDSPYTIRWIGILKATSTFTQSELNNLFRYFRLSVWWNNSLNAYGRVKENRGIGKNSWPPYETESIALFARMAAAGEPATSARKTIINTAIAALKTDGIWAKLDFLHVEAAHGNASARLNWIGDVYNLTDGVAPTFTIDQGFAGNGSSKYLRTGFNPGIAGIKYSRNSATLGCYSRTSGAETGIFMGASTVCEFYVNYGSGVFYFFVNGTELSTTGSTGAGLFTVVRDGATTEKAYIGKTKTDKTNSSVLPDPVELYILCFNAGTPNQFSNKQIAMDFGGSALTPTEQGLLYDIMVTGYLTSIGAQ